MIFRLGMFHCFEGISKKNNIFFMFQELSDHLRLMNPSQVMGLAPVENIYSVVENIPYFGPPGVGLNAGVMLMNLTRMRNMAGGGFTGSIRSA